MLLTLGAVLLYQQFRGEFAGRAGGDPGTKVTLTIVAESSGARLTLRVDPRYLGLIPANVRADINASTVFGNKYVALRAPDNPVAQRLSPGGRVAGRRSPASFGPPIFSEHVWGRQIGAPTINP